VDELGTDGRCPMRIGTAAITNRRVGLEVLHQRVDIGRILRAPGEGLSNCCSSSRLIMSPVRNVGCRASAILLVEIDRAAARSEDDRSGATRDAPVGFAMPDLPDYELLKTDETEAEATVKPRRWIAAFLVVAAVAIAAYFVYSRRPTASPPPQAARTALPAQQPVRPLGGQAEPVTVPPLDQSDPIVRDLVRRITSHPAVMAWLTTNGLIRNFTVVVANIAEGTTPARQLRVLRPASPFRVVEQNRTLVIDPRSYERYDRLAAAAASIDPAGAARLYATLKPRIEEAYGELGLPPKTFDGALERAIVSLLKTPVVDGPVRVETKGGIGYRYADPKLEELTAAQRNLLRTGPRNVRIAQSALRQLALALGIPSERLP